MQLDSPGKLHQCSQNSYGNIVAACLTRQTEPMFPKCLWEYWCSLPHQANYTNVPKMLMGTLVQLASPGKLHQCSHKPSGNIGAACLTTSIGNGSTNFPTRLVGTLVQFASPGKLHQCSQNAYGNIGPACLTRNLIILYQKQNYGSACNL